MKAIYAKPTTNLILNGEKPKAFPLKSEQNKDAHIGALLFSIVLELLDSAIKEEKEIKVTKLEEKGAIKMVEEQDTNITSSKKYMYT